MPNLPRSLIALVCLGSGIAWACLIGRLRHRPRNLERGTQHLSLFGTAGLVAGIAAAVVVLATG